MLADLWPQPQSKHLGSKYPFSPVISPSTLTVSWESRSQNGYRPGGAPESPQPVSPAWDTIAPTLAACCSYGLALGGCSLDFCELLLVINKLFPTAGRGAVCLTACGILLGKN